MPNLVPVNPGERHAAEQVQAVATQTTSLMIGELRKADQVAVLRKQVIALLNQEVSDYPAGSEAFDLFAQAIATLSHAERVVRLRGQTNGG